MIKNINIKNISYQYINGKGFEIINFILNPQANFTENISTYDKTHEIQKEYMEIKDDIIKKLNFSIEKPSIEQKILPYEIREESILIRPKNIARVNQKNRTKLLEEKIAIGYTISVNSTIDLRVNNDSCSQKTIQEFYRFILSQYDIIYNEKDSPIFDEIESLFLLKKIISNKG